MKKVLQTISAMAICGSLICSCSSDDATEGAEGGGASGGNGTPGVEAVSSYVTVGSVGEDVSYVLAPESLNSGDITAVGNGVEIGFASAATWVFVGDQYLYRLAYNRGSDGVTAAFYLGSDGKLAKRRYTYNISNFTAYGTYGKYLITSATGATSETDDAGNAAYGITFSIIDTENEDAEVTFKTISAENLLGNKEYVMIGGMLESNGKLYASIVPLGCSPYGVAAGGVLDTNRDLVSDEAGGTGGGRYEANSLSGTQYPNNCYIAVYDNIDFTNPTIIQTDKMSWAAGRMRAAYYQTIWAADNGDIYVFSPSFAKTEGDPRQQTTHPSSVMRIKAGASDFDYTYGDEGVVNIEALSEGKEVYRCWHIAGDYFLLQMYAQGLNIQGKGTTRMAIYKGEDKTLKYVEGLPDPDVISSFSTKNPYSENGLCYISVETTDGAKPRIYSIDPTTATATPGLNVEVDEINAIGKLTSH